MFPTYDIESPDGATTITIGPLSYVTAALFGGFYVLFKAGTGRIISAAFWTVFFAFLLMVVAFLAALLSGPLQGLVIIIAVPTVLVVQSVRMIQLVRSTYRRRGWLIQTR